MTPSQLPIPAFLMNVPLSFSAEVANNKWMEDWSADDRRIDRSKALEQFFALYHYLGSKALVTLLPGPHDCGLQDLVFTANVGFIPEHRLSEVVISRFTIPNRSGEADLAARFFKDMGYMVHCCPHRFEGEADLRYVRDNIYVGGYGQRSSKEAFDWMEREFDIQIIKVRLRDPYSYHLDCSVLPIDGERTLVATGLFNDNELREIESVTEIVPVETEAALMGLCNSVMLGNTWLTGSAIDELPADHEYYDAESRKLRTLEQTAARLNKDIRCFNISEYYKGGAALSCMLMHLNRSAYPGRSFAED